MTRFSSSRSIYLAKRTEEDRKPQHPGQTHLASLNHIQIHHRRPEPRVVPEVPAPVVVRETASVPILLATNPTVKKIHEAAEASMSSTNGASYDGSSGRSFPLVTEKWIRDHPEEVQQAREAQGYESDDDDESVVEDYHANRDGLSGTAYPQVSGEGDATTDTRNGDSKLGKLMEKTGEKLGSDRLAEKGRKKRAAHPV
ncbi:hypothetical protein PpBr36_03711 [Pyricularia pennisetigena]|uniref:hypothetical protein n=1 Tax=Pyricularia pennisetigena TaxID=1578925 RepID=UPI00114EBC62|nr:hypothetical protein PpBr36_03711 [Pyricularia pennisetigena]TLS31266.1 hypothetical protein PpBr36_03711 [Pyricularia pennisetigena]